MQFVVPKAHLVAAMNRCHHDAGYQGQQQTLCLLHDQLWWPGMATQMQEAISSCKQCIQHEGTLPKRQCYASLLLLLWSYYMLTLPAWKQ